jgi:NAD(P)-dependent dehydrogenase (short-subunit alcohol dehydrogenase family)
VNLKDKVAVITGAASGIGRAAALRFKQEGAAGLVLGDIGFRKIDSTRTVYGSL